MTEQPKPHAYCAALLFDDGQLLLMPVIGPDAPGAMAIAAYQAGQHTETKGHLTGYRLIELEAGWLRQALRLLEGGKPTGDVVSLVSDNLRPKPPTLGELDAHLREVALRGITSDNLRPASPFRAMTQPEAERILEGAAEVERGALNGQQQAPPAHDPRPFARDCGHNVTLVRTPRGYECPVCQSNQ